MVHLCSPQAAKRFTWRLAPSKTRLTTDYSESAREGMQKASSATAPARGHPAVGGRPGLASSPVVVTFYLVMAHGHHLSPALR